MAGASPARVRVWGDWKREKFVLYYASALELAAHDDVPACLVPAVLAAHHRGDRPAHAFGLWRGGPELLPGLDGHRLGAGADLGPGGQSQPACDRDRERPGGALKTEHRRHGLARVKDVLGIERGFEPPHG